MALTILRENSLYAKQNKCSFDMHKVEYLGHVISRKGVSTNPKKIHVVQHWPTPKSLKQLRGFLGLTS